MHLEDSVAVVERAEEILVAERSRSAVNRFDVEQRPLHCQFLIQDFLRVQFLNGFRTSCQFTVALQMLINVKRNKEKEKRNE